MSDSAQFSIAMLVLAITPVVYIEVSRRISIALKRREVRRAVRRQMDIAIEGSWFDDLGYTRIDTLTDDERRAMDDEYRIRRELEDQIQFECDEYPETL